MRFIIGLALVCLNVGHAQQAGVPKLDAPKFNVRAAFAAQLEASARAGFAYIKTVLATNPDQGEGSQLTKAYTVSLISGRSEMRPTPPNAETSKDFAPEVNYAVEYAIEDEALKDYFTVEVVGDTITGRIKPNCEEKTNLHAQKFVRIGNVLRYVSCSIVRSSWLYTTHIDTEVFFNEKGRYQRHTLNMRTEIRWVAFSTSARIEGVGVGQYGTL